VSDPREELIRWGIEASNQGAFEEVLPYLDPDIVVSTETELGNHLYRDREQALAAITA
jgi:hypothetical protein